MVEVAKGVARVVVAAICSGFCACVAANDGLRLKFSMVPHAPAVAMVPPSSPRPEPLRLTPAAHAALESTIAREDADALVALATRYAHAEGVPRDAHKAHELYCAAARYGHAEALFQLGWNYANGRGVARDDGVAAGLFQAAAERGHRHAPKVLSVMPARPDMPLPACVIPASLPLAIAPPAMPAREADAAPAVPPAPKEIAQLVQRLAPQFEVDANLVLAVIAVESGFNPAALSPARAQGLMQLIPETAERFGVKRPFNPDDNVRGGLAYLRWLLAYFKGDVPLVLAAYNAGEGAVEKFRGIPPYAETQDYVKKILGMYRRMTHPYNGTVVAPSPALNSIKRM